MSNKFTNNQKNDILTTLGVLFGFMNECEKKAVLHILGLKKDEIEDMDIDTAETKLKEIYRPIVEAFDMDNPPNLDGKFKKAAQFMSGKNKDTLKTEIEKYKKL